MKKTLGLDLGDKWIGVAISDSSGKYSFPLKTIEKKDLPAFLKEITRSESISNIIYGLPITLKGEIGSQAKKTNELVIFLEKSLCNPDISFISVDERFSSSSAQKIARQNCSVKNKNEHSIAAALLLEVFLKQQELRQES